MKAVGRLARLVAVVVGILVASGAAVTMLVQRQGVVVEAFGQLDWTMATLLLGAASALVAVGGAAWFGRPASALALVATWAAASWLAPELTVGLAVPREVRAVARLLVPLVTPLLVHVAISAPPGERLGRTGLVSLGACYGVAAILAIGHVTTWDPYRVLACPAPCAPGDNVLLVRADIDLSERFLAAWAALTLIAGVALALREIAALTRGPARGASERAIRSSALAMGVAMAWWASDRVAGDGARVDASQVPAMAALSLSVIALGVTTTICLLVEVRRSNLLRHLADLIGTDTAPRTLQDVLTITLGDPTVRVAYPLDSGDVVDVAGRPVLLSDTGQGRRFATIERRGEAVAVVEHADAVDAAPLAREIGTASRLAVDNERLDATVRARLRELQGSRARIVATGDATRRRIERDLHDGAQQRLLAVSFELRLARASITDPRSTVAVELDDAIERLDHALNELRELAHGIHPAVLSEAGLDAAIRSFAESSPLPVEVDGPLGLRCPPTTESAAYLAVVEAAQRAAADGAKRLAVGLRNEGGVLRMDMASDAEPRDRDWERVVDRVGAAGGRVSITAGVGGPRLQLELPCA